MTSPVLNFNELMYAWLGNHSALRNSLADVFWNLLTTTDYYGNENNLRNIDAAINSINEALLRKHLLEYEVNKGMLDMIDKEEHLLYPNLIKDLISDCLSLEEIKSKLELIRGGKRPV